MMLFNSYFQEMKAIISMEVLVHFKMLRNLTGFTSGRFAIRLCLEGAGVESVPVNILNHQQKQLQNASSFDEKHFTTRSFLLKAALPVDINEACLFRVTLPIDGEIILICDILQIQQGKMKLVQTYRGKICGPSCHQYLEIDFYEAAPCQLVGSLHAAPYKYQFLQGQDTIDFRSYCEAHSPATVDQFMNYFQAQSTQSLEYIAKHYNMITGKELDPSMKKVQKIQKSLSSQKSQKSLKIIAKEELPQLKDTEPTQMDEDVIPKKKRRKIFQNFEQDKDKLAKYDAYEKILHQYSQKIYQIWRQITSVLLQEEGNRFIEKRGAVYHSLLQERVGESVIRFKGSWDIDIYGDEQKQRSTLAYQLRNRDQEFFKQLKGQEESMFALLNQAFFSKLRPVLFEDFATRENSPKAEVPEQILVVLVHGLGACRLDMERIKVELRRYYDKRVRIFVSTSNQGRTEGDIENMGMRLAAELEHQFSKYQQPPTVCMLGHSMGGVIIRSALPRLQKYSKCFHSFITLSSPHLGYTYSTSKLVDAGLWLMNTMKQCKSILQLTMQDSETIEQTFLYQLSKKKGLEWFKKIVLLASHQDLYVPYYSARIQKHEESTLDLRKNVKKGMVYCTMVDNIIGGLTAQIMRVNINFCIPEQNIDNLIGRAAHISFINNAETVRTFILAGKHYFF